MEWVELLSTMKKSMISKLYRQSQVKGSISFPFLTFSLFYFSVESKVSSILKLSRQVHLFQIRNIKFLQIAPRFPPCKIFLMKMTKWLVLELEKKYFHFLHNCYSLQKKMWNMSGKLWANIWRYYPFWDGNGTFVYMLTRLTCLDS